MTINSGAIPRGVKDLVRRSRTGAVVALVGFLAGCGAGTELPSPRPLILHSGARLSPDAQRMGEIDRWVQPQVERIREDPSFLIRTVAQREAIYPWEGIEFRGDTVEIHFLGGVAEARVPILVYAHLHLLHRRGTEALAEWMPEAADAEGYDLERAIMERVADAWLYGRAVWDAPPHQVLDEIVYARENGFLDAFLLTARPQEFADARERWIEENPDGIEDYRQWFVETFDREPPGLREESAAP